MRILWMMLCICFTLTACNEKDWEQPVEVSGISETVTIDRTDVYNLTISGMNNSVTVGKDNKINNLSITGFNNILTIGKNTTVKNFKISGADNTVYVPLGSGITFEDTGLGNHLIEQ
jgi:hypothetical protein